ncbi:uncharacterized protein LOC128652178 isoform X2 [Bombina bombina]|uniref:uncharacterized protein LOC128652178 isoform X2 n=1 Tax=Bombina bombina TaxID=8345 RepID=UPI00235AE5FC|nr:uncharacterized protein LOC128652178 isoform X2 [Bombina bombina]
MEKNQQKAKAQVFEIQHDYTVKKEEVSLLFLRNGSKQLYIVSNQDTKFGLLHKAPAQQTLQKDFRKDVQSEFHYGISSKVFSVESSECEVRLLLSSAEISRLSATFNLSGFVSSYLVSDDCSNHLRSLLDKKDSAAAQKICKSALRFFCPSKDVAENEFSNTLNEILVKKVIGTCKDLSNQADIMVLCALVALVAADVAAKWEDLAEFKNIKDNEEHITNSDDSHQNTQFEEMITHFELEATLLPLVYQGKRVYVVFRNSKEKEWALGGTKETSSGNIFSIGLCHKVFSVFLAGCVIKFIQNLQETYYMTARFHLPGFAKQLLMSEKWREKLKNLYTENDEKEEVIEELSQFAMRFFCAEDYQREIFINRFKKIMREKCCGRHNVQAGDEGLYFLGTLLSIKAALTAASIKDGDKDDGFEDGNKNNGQDVSYNEPESTENKATNPGEQNNEENEVNQPGTESTEENEGDNHSETNNEENAASKPKGSNINEKESSQTADGNTEDKEASQPNKDNNSSEGGKKTGWFFNLFSFLGGLFVGLSSILGLSNLFGAGAGAAALPNIPIPRLPSGGGSNLPDVGQRGPTPDVGQRGPTPDNHDCASSQNQARETNVNPDEGPKKAAHSINKAVTRATVAAGSAIGLSVLYLFRWKILKAILNWLLNKIPNWKNILLIMIFLILFSFYFFTDEFIRVVTTKLMPTLPTLLIAVAVALCVMLVASRIK